MQDKNLSTCSFSFSWKNTAFHSENRFKTRKKFLKTVCLNKNSFWVQENLLEYSVLRQCGCQWSHSPFSKKIPQFLFWTNCVSFCLLNACLENAKVPIQKFKSQQKWEFAFPYIWCHYDMLNVTFLSQLFTCKKTILPFSLFLTLFHDISRSRKTHAKFWQH